MRFAVAAVVLLAGFGSATAAEPRVPSDSTPQQPGLVMQEFLYDEAEFPQCHASTIERTPTGLVAAWFGGTREKNDDVAIWVSRREGNGWTQPRRVDEGVRDGRDFPCWNPVLFQPKSGPLTLFFKVGPSPSRWWGEVATSTDGGKTWSDPRRLPEGVLGPIKNKPVQLDDGTILSGSSTEHDGWRVHFERSEDGGKTWSATKPINDGRTFGIIQPTILRTPDGSLQALFRSRQGRIVASRSKDGGRTWSAPEATELPNPNSGIDAVTLADGRHVLVYNHTERGRSPLNVAVSPDGTEWFAAGVLEDQPGEYSYPAVIQADDGRVHVTYTWKRQRVKHVVLDPEAFELRKIEDGAWPR